MRKFLIVMILLVSNMFGMNMVVDRIETPPISNKEEPKEMTKEDIERKRIDKLLSKIQRVINKDIDIPSGFGVYRLSVGSSSNLDRILFITESKDPTIYLSVYGDRYIASPIMFADRLIAFTNLAYIENQEKLLRQFPQYNNVLSIVTVILYNSSYFSVYENFKKYGIELELLPEFK